MKACAKALGEPLIEGSDDIKMSSHTDLTGFLEICEWIGKISRSFPIWRFPSIRFGDRSLLENFGFTRLERSTDRYPGSALPDPDCDLYGRGFVRIDNHRYLELRRAYIAISLFDDANLSNGDGRITLIVRNNSKFFGRDRLPYAALISFRHFDAEELYTLSQTKFEDHELFLPLQHLPALPEIFEPTIDKIRVCLDEYTQFATMFSGSLEMRGADDLIELLESLKTQGKPLPFLGFIPLGETPAQPRDVIYSGDLIEMGGQTVALRNHLSQHRRPGDGFVLLSGAHGDMV